MAATSNTAIADQLAAKGVTPRNVKFQIALAEFQNNGGEYGVALAMLNAAYGRGAKADVTLPSGRMQIADAPLQNDDVGRPSRAEEADRVSPASSPDRSPGRTGSAEMALAAVPVAANHPGHARRDLRAISSVQGAVSKSLFDTTLLPDGRRLRDVRWNECPALAGRYRRLSRIFMAVHNHARPVNPDDTLDQIVSEDGLAQIISAVELTNDIQ